MTRPSWATAAPPTRRSWEVVHCETNRLCWYGEDVEAERPRLLTQVGLPEGTDEDTARRVTARVLRGSETVGLLRPGRVATVVDTVTEAGTLWTVAEWSDGTPLAELSAERGTFSCVCTARIGLKLLYRAPEGLSVALPAGTAARLGADPSRGRRPRHPAPLSQWLRDELVRTGHRPADALAVEGARAPAIGALEC